MAVPPNRRFVISRKRSVRSATGGGRTVVSINSSRPERTSSRRARVSRPPERHRRVLHQGGVRGEAGAERADDPEVALAWAAAAAAPRRARTARSATTGCRRRAGPRAPRRARSRAVRARARPRRARGARPRASPSGRRPTGATPCASSSSVISRRQAAPARTGTSRLSTFRRWPPSVRKRSASRHSGSTSDRNPRNRGPRRVAARCRSRRAGGWRPPNRRRRSRSRSRGRARRRAGMAALQISVHTTAAVPSGCAARKWHACSSAGSAAPQPMPTRSARRTSGRRPARSATYDVSPGQR